MSKPRIILFAYHQLGHDTLKMLHERGDNVVAVFTHEDNPNEKVFFDTPAIYAKAHGIPFYTPKSVKKPEQVEFVKSLQPDLIFSFYYRLIIPQEILDLPKLGAFNMHGSLLPKYRGRAPVNWVVVNGETESGVTLHHMVAEVDAGDIVDQEAFPIEDEDTAYDVGKKTFVAAQKVIQRQIDALLTGTAPRRPQNHAESTYFGGRTPEDGRIDWALTTQEIYNLIRAVTHPFPGAFTTLEGAEFKIWKSRRLPRADRPAVPGEIVCASPLQIATSDGVLEVLEHDGAEAIKDKLTKGSILGQDHGMQIGQDALSV